MQPDRFFAIRTTLALAIAGTALGLAACSGQEFGAIRVVTTTNGSDLDTDGYYVRIGDHEYLIGTNSSMLIVDVPVGENPVELMSIRGNCLVVGSNPRMANVEKGSARDVMFEVRCEPEAPLTLNVTTTGTQLDNNGYTAVVNTYARSRIGVNGSFEVVGLEGTNTVGLDDVAGNCTVIGANPRNVNADADLGASLDFEIECGEHATVIVEVETTGDDIDSNGYAIVLDDHDATFVDANGSVTFNFVEPGAHTIDILSIAGNCTLNESRPASFEVAIGDIHTVRFSLECAMVSTAALLFNGSNYASVPDDGDLHVGGSGTIEFWFNIDTVAGRQVIIDGPDAYNIEIRDGGRICLNFLSGANSGTPFCSSTAVTADTWQHVAFVWGNGGLRLYRNGSTHVSVNGLSGPADASGGLMMGAENGTDHFYDGLLDEVRLWTSARSAQEIADNYNRQIDPNSSGLVAYWQLDEGEGATSADATGDGHTLTLGNSDVGDAAEPVWHPGGRP